MNQSRYGTLISLLLLLLLTAGFFLAARYAIKAVNGSVQNAMATATVIVLPPTPTVPVKPTVDTHKVKRPAVATATPTPNQQGQIVVSTTSSASGATSTFPTSTSKFWCVANLPTIPLGTGIVWKWLHVLSGNNTEEIWTSIPYTYNSVVRYGYINGPFAAGSYRCEVIAGNQVIGAADFSVK